MQANTTSWPLSQRQGSAHSTHTKIFNVRLRSSKHPRYVDVKTRLIALWHQSLRHEKSRAGTMYSNSNKGARKKVGFTARDEPLMQQTRPRQEHRDKTEPTNTRTGQGRESAGPIDRSNWSLGSRILWTNRKRNVLGVLIKRSKSREG